MKKKLIMGIGGFLVIMIGLFFLTSQQSVKTNGTIKKQNDKKIETSQAQPNKNTTTDGAKSANDTGGKTQSTNDAGGKAQSTNDAGGKAQSTSTNDKQPSSQNGQILVEKYQPKFQELMNTADKRVDNLIEQAKMEVKDKKDKHINVQRLPAKYAGILNRYEQTTKLQFDTIYGQFQEEATKSKLSDTTGKVFQVEYETKKDQRGQKFKEELKKLIG